MALRRHGALLCLLVLSVSSQISPVSKVVNLIKEMKGTAEKDGQEDTEAFDKYMCWCKTNRGEKTGAVEYADSEIASLTAFVEEAAGQAGQLKTDIQSLETEIANDQDALTTATKAREGEREDFGTAEGDSRETRGLLGQAIEILRKVQFTQVSAGVPQEAHAVLLQVRDRIASKSPQFRGVMERDLFDMMDSLQHVAPQQGTFLRRDASFQQQKLLPWETTEEQDGAAANPNDLSGAAAGAKSYNSRSGKIIGVLGTMHDKVSVDLETAQKEELAAEVNFQKLRAAKNSEIEIGIEQRDNKQTQLADLLDKSAKAKKDIAAMEEAMSADQRFLANLEKNCQKEKDNYEGRVKIRTDEIEALNQTLEILTADDARDVFGRSVEKRVPKFVQLSVSQRVEVQDRVTERAMKRIAAVAERHGNWALASLAVRVRLDAFTKVKAAMDTMTAELKKEQKDEDAKLEYCRIEIDRTEDDIKVGTQKKEDLAAKHKNLANQIETLTAEIAELKLDVKDMEINLKRASEDRKEENNVYQLSTSDQHAVVHILNKAKDRLEEFYHNRDALVQVNAHQPKPGAYVAPPPPSPKGYEKSGGAGGVTQLLAKIISEAEAEIGVLKVDENFAQKAYASNVRDTSASIKANRKAITNKSSQVAHAQEGKSETEEDQSTNNEDLMGLTKTLAERHAECDYLIKNYNVRKTARTEELEAIDDAKAILSGADFGK